mgnify:CR=1 FL=1
MSEGETPTPSPPSRIRYASVEVESLVNECNHLHQENEHLRDLVCWLRGTLEGLQPLSTVDGFTHTQLIIHERYSDFFSRKEMEDAWDIVIQQDIGEANGE